MSSLQAIKFYFGNWEDIEPFHLKLFMDKRNSFRVDYEERCGRQLIATRDILPGEILFNDTEGVVGVRFFF